LFDVLSAAIDVIRAFSVLLSLPYKVVIPLSGQAGIPAVSLFTDNWHRGEITIHWRCNRSNVARSTHGYSDMASSHFFAACFETSAKMCWCANRWPTADWQQRTACVLMRLPTL